MERQDLWVIKYFKKYSSLFDSNFLKDINCTNKLFFLCTYSQAELILTKKLIWPNAKIINFINVEDFINRYRKKNFTTGDTTIEYFKNNWNIISGTDWPDFPCNIEQFENLSDDICKEFLDLVGKQNYKVLKQYLQTEQQYQDLVNTESISWNVSWYFDEDKTVEKIKNLYQELGLDDFNEEYIRQYYRLWLQVLNKLK